MRIYPDTANERGRAVARDALTLLALFVFAWLALKVHDAVDQLAVLGTGVRDTGTAVEDGFEAAGDAVSGVPVVGGELGGALREAGSGTGGEVADAGRAGEERVHDLANLLGVLFFALPTAVLLVTTLPGRITQITRAERRPEPARPTGVRGAPPPDRDASGLLSPCEGPGAPYEGSARRPRDRPLRRTGRSGLRGRRPRPAPLLNHSSPSRVDCHGDD